MNNLIQCSKCKTKNHPKQIKIYDNEIEPGIQARLWLCPNCNHKHLITVMDKTARRMMKANKEDRDKIGNINNRARSGDLNLKQMEHNLERADKLNEIIDERTGKLDERMKGLIDEYKEKV